MALTSSVMGQMTARFRNFYSLSKVKIWLKKGAKNLNAFLTGAKIYFCEKKKLRVRCTLTKANRYSNNLGSVFMNRAPDRQT